MIGRIILAPFGPAASARTFDAELWRADWFRKVGYLGRDLKTGGLLLLFSANRDDADRKMLFVELARTPGGVTAVLDECDGNKLREDAETLALWAGETTRNPNALGPRFRRPDIIGPPCPSSLLAAVQPAFVPERLAA